MPPLRMSVFDISNRLLTFAWSIEFAIAGFDLTYAIDRLPDGAGLDGIIGALPFFVVAIIGLSKIPLAFIFYTKKSRFIKGVSLIALGLAMITQFETIFISIETSLLLANWDLADNLIWPVFIGIIISSLGTILAFRAFVIRKRQMLVPD